MSDKKKKKLEKKETSKIIRTQAALSTLKYGRGVH